MVNKDVERWRLLLEGANCADYNMTVDWVLLNYTELPVLRFYLWAPPALSLGWSQSPDDLDREAIIEDGLDVVFRPTGGRAIYHHGELTYSVIFPWGHPITQMTIMESYERISQALVAGLHNLGIQAEFGRGERNLYKNPSCFASTSRYEVLVNGKKIIGSAQRRTKKGLVQQGTILIDKSYLKLSKYIAPDKDKTSFVSKSISLSEIPQNKAEIEKMRSALISGFESAFGVVFSQDYLLDEEHKAVKNLLANNLYMPFSRKIKLDIDSM